MCELKGYRICNAVYGRNILMRLGEASLGFGQQGRQNVCDCDNDEAIVQESESAFVCPDEAADPTPIA